MHVLSRRKLIQTAAAASLLGTLTSRAQVVTNLRMVVGFPAGGQSDVLARAVCDRLRGGYASIALVDNKPGAAARIAVDVVKGAAPDGQTALLSPMSVMSLYPHVYKALRYDPWVDLTPVTAVSRGALALFAGPGLPSQVSSLADLATWAKNNATKANFGSPAVGSSPHLTGLIYAKLSGQDWQPIGYQGAAPAIVALLGGELPIYYGSIGDGVEHVRAGKLRVLATTGGRRSTFLPDVPTFVEQGFPTLVVEEHHSIFLPGHVSPSVLDNFSKAVRSAVGSREVTDILTRFALEPVGNAPAELMAIQRADSERWGAMVKTIGYTAAE